LLGVLPRGNFHALRQQRTTMRRTSILLAVIASVPVAAQSPRALTAADYARAERFMGYNVTPLVFGTGVRPTWLPDERFWYRTLTPEGGAAFIVDPAKRSRARAFDPARLADAIAQAGGRRYEPRQFPFDAITLSGIVGHDSVTFDSDNRRWRCDVQDNRCTAADVVRDQSSGGRSGRGGRGSARPEVLSPDGKRAVFIRDWNLWVRDVVTGRTTQITTDGVKDFGYATDNAGWARSDRPIVLWSPDSRKVATFQQDQRGTGEMYLVDTRAGHPNLQAWKYPLPGDSTVTTIQRVIIDLDSAHVIRFQMPPDQHRSTLCDDVACRGDWSDVQWSADSRAVAFISTSRDHKEEHLRVADAMTGAVREVLQETVATFYESGNGRANWRYLPNSNEVIWFSERDDWGQLYLYDLTTGKLKHPITSGEGNVTQLLRVDEKTRTLYFAAVGKERGRDPYFRHLYRIGMDGKGLTLLTPEDADHDVTLSPSGRWFVDSYSRPDVPPITVLRDANGKLLATLERADISRLVATGWKPPVPITVKARDGKTDLYGLLYRPTTFDSTRRYPIVNHIYPGPQTGSVGGRSFNPARGDAQALAELGFVVVEIDGMGTPWRSKTFHAAYYGDMGDNTLPDQVAGMKELARRYSWIDLDRAGIYGHSGGGYATADAMFRYPDFFKVGISEAGNHDNRVYEDDWGEKWQGLLTTKPDGSTNYDSQANQNIAKNLKGKLLLAHGTMDNNVPPYNTLLVVDALIKANKDFDLLMLPNRNHGFGNEPYMVRRRWDYFVKWLLGAEPPREYELRPPEARSAVVP
jgi:dipeptidyl aminopeptidase/acylaminoacyl peptidase